MKQFFRNRRRESQQARRKSFLQSQFAGRKMLCEKLEERAMMAADFLVSDYWNAFQPADVNNDSHVAPDDALAIINALNSGGSRQLMSGNKSLAPRLGGEGEDAAPADGSDGYYYDVNNDGYLSPIDALGVINQLNSLGPSGELMSYYFRTLAVGTNDDITTIAKGQDFDLQVLVQDLRNGGRGVFAGFVDLNLSQLGKTSVYVHEAQDLSVNGTPTSGNFTMVYNGTTSTAVTIGNFDSAGIIAGKIQNALNSIPALNGNVSVFYDPIPDVDGVPGVPNRWQIRFINALGDQDVANVTIGTNSLKDSANNPLTPVIVETAKGVNTDPNAFREAFRSTRIPSIVDPVIYSNFLFAEDKPGQFNDVGAAATGSSPFPGTQPTELVRVRLHAIDGTDGGQPLTFVADLNNVITPAHYTLLYDINGQILPSQILLNPNAAITITERLSAITDATTTTENTPTGLLDVLANDTLNGTANAGAISIKSVDNTGTQGTAVIDTSGGARGKIKFTPAPGFSGVTTFKYTIGATGEIDDTTTVTVTVGAVNDAPTITVVSPQSINEDATLTFSAANANAIVVNDSDANGAAVKTTLTTPNGKLTLSSISGLTFNNGANGTGAMTFTATLADTNAALNGLVYTPNLNYNTTPGSPTNITISTDDLGNTGNGGAKTGSSTVFVSVGAVNDAPVNTLGFAGQQTATENENLVFSSAQGRSISISDVDASGATVQVDLTATKGNLTLASTSGLTVTGNGTTSVHITGSISSINNALNGLAYLSLPGQFGADTLTVLTNDLGNTGAGGPQTASTPISINVVPAIRPRAINDSFTVLEDSVNNIFDVMNNPAGKDLANIPDPTVYKTTLKSFTQPVDIAAGFVALNDNGTPADLTDDTLLFTPFFDYFGTTTFTYTINDTKGTGLDSTATVTVTVTNVNDAPEGTSKTVTTNEDTSYTFTAADFGFSDPIDNGANALAGVKVSTLPLPAGGTLSNDGGPVALGQVISASDINAGKFKFKPALDINGNGAASFTFQVQDDGGVDNGGVDLDLTPRTMTFNVTPVNDAPTFVKGPDQNIMEDAGPQTNIPWATAISVGPANEAADGQTIVGFQVTGNTNPGMFLTQPTIDATGHLSYLTKPNANGVATITVVLVDSGSSTAPNVNTSASQSFVINVGPVNDAPIANDDNITVGEDGSIDFNPLANDSDIESNPLSLSIAVLSGPSNGTLTPLGGGVYRYAPNPDYNGPDSFTYQIIDGSVLSNIATVHITVTDVNDPPVANNDSIAVTEDVPFTFDARTNDTDPESPSSALAIGSFTQPKRGGVQVGSLVLNANNTFTYTPALNDNSVEHPAPLTFTYFVSDGQNTSLAPATVTITIAPVNDAPVANPDGPFTLIKNFVDQEIAGVLTNDTDVDAGTVLNISQLQGAAATPGSPTTFATAHGVVKLGLNNKILYTPDANYEGPDSFTYTASDGGLTSTATVSITVVNFLPTDITGTVYIDSTTTGVQGQLDAYDARMANVEVRLTGVDLTGANVNLVVLTNAQGLYVFPGVFPNMPGQPYTLRETQPAYFVDGNEVGGGAFALADGNDQFKIVLPQLGIAGGAHNTNFAESQINATALPDAKGLAAEIFISSSGNGMVASSGMGDNWFYALNGWGNLTNVLVTFDTDLSKATLNYTDAGGTHAKTIFQDPNDVRNVGKPAGSMARFRILGSDNAGGYIIRVDGTAAEFGISLASAGGEGEAPLSEGAYTAGVDAVFAEESWA